MSGADLMSLRVPKATTREEDLLATAVMLLWDIYLDDKSQTQILDFMEEADHEGWRDEVQAAADIEETYDSMRGPL